MSKITYSNKQAGDQVGSDVFNEIKAVVNANDDSKAPLVGGTVPIANLPVANFDPNQFIIVLDGNGNATIQVDPSKLSTSFTTITGYSASQQQMLYNNFGSIAWGPVPTGAALPDLGSTTLTAGTANSDSIPFTWTAVTDAQSYQLQLSTSSSFTSPIINSYTTNSGMPTGLTASTTYYARVRAIASGFNAGPWSSTVTKATDVQGNVTPPAPTGGVVDDSANTFTYTPATGSTATQHEYSLDTGSTWADATSNVIAVGNVAKAVGAVRVRVKARTGVNTGPVLSNATAFTVAAGAGTPQDLVLENPGSALTNTSGVWTYPGTGSRINVDAQVKMPANVKSRVAIRNTKTNNDTRVFFGIDTVKADGYQGWDAAILASPFQSETYLEFKENNTGIPGDKKATVNYISIAKSASGVITAEESNDGITWTVVSTYTLVSTAELFITFSFESGGKVYNPQLITY